MDRKFAQVYAVAICLAIWPGSAAGQNIYGSLTGTVTDESGAVIPGVTITASNTGTGLTRTTITNERGGYSITLLPTGQYSVSAELPGFRKELRSGIVLQVDQTGRADFQMKVGQVSEVVEVTAAAPLVASETSSVGNVIDTTKVVELPLNGRDFKDLALLVPNAIPTGQGTTHATRGGFNVAGSREVSNNFLLDGVDNNDPTVNLFTLKPSIEIVQEFKVQTNSYTAESGRYSGGQINMTTKSGTNNLHGSLFYFVRDDSLDAKNFFDKPNDPIPPFHRDQFGGSLGGPIIRNRTHFFGGYEGVRVTKSETLLASVPNARFLTGDFSQLLTPGNPFTGAPRQVVDPVTKVPFPGNIIPTDRFDRVSRLVAAMYPVPNRSEDPIINFISNPEAIDDSNQYNIRVDHQWNDKLRSFSRYSLSRQYVLDAYDHFHRPTKLPGWGRVEPTHTQHVVFNTTWVMTPKLVNEVRLGYNRFQQSRSAINKNDGVTQLGLNQFVDPAFNLGLNRGFPLFNITGFDAIGSSSGQPQQRSDNTYQIVNHISYVTGNHAVKAGIDLLKFQEYDIINSNIRGNYTFNGQFSNNAFADFLLGVPSQTARLILPEQWRYMEHYAHGFFIQDDWKVLPTLTMNIGLRYEIDGPLRDKYNRVGRFDPASNQLILARTKDSRFDPNGALRPLIDRFYPITRTPIVIRDADTAWDTDHNNFAPRFGLAWRPFNNNTTVLRAGYGVFYDGMVVGNGFAGFGPSLPPFRFAQTLRAALTAPNITMSNPFPDNIATPALQPAAVDGQYVMPYSQQWNLGIERQLTQNIVVEVGYVGNKGTKLSRSRNINQAVQGAGAVDVRRPFPWFGNIGYRESSANSQYHSMQVRVEKRFSAGQSFLSSYTLGKSIDDDSGSEGQGGAGAQNAYDLRSSKGLSSFDVRNRWAFSYTAEIPVGKGHRWGGGWSPVVDLFLGGWELAGIVTLQTGRPITVVYGADRSATGQGNDRPNLIGDANLPSSERTIQKWFNTSAFVAQPAGQFGNAGRNIVTGPPLRNMDFSLKKDVTFKESQVVQFRAEFFNVLNHPNFEYPDRTFNSQQFGRISGALQSRQIQFGLRYAF